MLLSSFFCLVSSFHSAPVDLTLRANAFPKADLADFPYLLCSVGLHLQSTETDVRPERYRKGVDKPHRRTDLLQTLSGHDEQVTVMTHNDGGACGIQAAPANCTFCSIPRSNQEELIGEGHDLGRMTTASLASNPFSGSDRRHQQICVLEN